MSETTTDAVHLRDLTTGIVAAYVAHNPIPASQLPPLIGQVHAALARLTSADAILDEEQPGPLTPAQIRKSITHDALISFVDGKPYKTLKRHLTVHGLDPDRYRQRYGLPHDYPMTAASYSAQRSVLAKAAGLGAQRRQVAA